MRLSPFTRKSLVGIDLGHHTIKAVMMERTASGWKIARTGAVPTPPDSIKDGVVIDQHAVAEALRNLLRESRCGANSAIIAVSGGTVVVRVVRIPKMPEATLRKSIKYEASRYVPNSTEDSYIEFEIVGQAEDNQMDVLIVAAPKDIVESRILACEAAGLSVEVVDISAFAAYRSLIEADPLQNWGETTVALVDIGATTTTMSVIEKGVFSMTRTIPHGGQMLTDALVSYFKLTPEDAESGKSQLDVSELIQDKTQKENPPLRIIQPHVDELVREIRRSLNYYQSQQSEGAQANTVAQVILCGGSATLSGISEYIGHKLSLPTTAISLFDNPRFSGTAPERVAARYDLAVASGLAMRAYAKAA
jgi:type IV pilus assembly protein PilM